MNATNPLRAGLTYTGKTMKLAISFTFRPVGFGVIGVVADSDHTLSVDGKWAFSRKEFRLAEARQVLRVRFVLQAGQRRGGSGHL